MITVGIASTGSDAQRRSFGNPTSSISAFTTPNWGSKIQSQMTAVATSEVTTGE